MSALTDRMLRAARLDARLFEEVERPAVRPRAGAC